MMLELAAFVGVVGGALLALAPMAFVRLFFRQYNEIVTNALVRAGDQIALADWTAWQVGRKPINPPKALLDLADARREWPSKWAGPVQFL